MSDVKCPCCGTWQDVNHDDGYGYDEGNDYSQCCHNCEKEFTFTTTVTYSYSTYCKNKSDHNMYQALPNEPDFFVCRNCDHSELRGD